MTSRAHSRVVNALTFARVPLILAWAALAVVQELLAASTGRGGVVLASVACAAMLLSGLTDAWDGALARRWNVVSPLGKMSDPLMDKIFYIVAFPVLSWQVMRQGGNEFHGLLMVGFTILYMARDTWVTFMRSVGAMYGADVAAMWLGKVRTALSFPGAGWIYAYLCFHAHVPSAWARLWLASCYFVEAGLIVLTLWSLHTYTAAYLPYLKRALEHR